ncbi:DNA polymerase I [bacterium]|nr:MAG: DNA polymerase I [bacterium]
MSTQTARSSLENTSEPSSTCRWKSSPISRVHSSVREKRAIIIGQQFAVSQPFQHGNCRFTLQITDFLDSMSKLLLVDGYSLLFRAFFSSPPFATKAGEPTGALYGFIRMVMKLLDENSPDYAVVAIDAPGNTFRHDSDENYKANRSETPPDLRSQQKLLHELLDGLSIPHYEHVGFEADDVIGTLATRGSAHGQEVIIFTGDGDYLQLVDENVSVFLTRRGVTDLEAYNPAAIMARFGFEAKQLPDFKGLKGDTSDNIPGVPGIGDKTGMSLIQKFGNLEGIYENLEEVTPPRIRELLRTHKDQAFRSRELATIVIDLPVEKQPEEFRYDPTNEEKRQLAAKTAHRFEFRSLALRFETPLGAPVVVAEAKALENFGVEPEVTDSPREALDWLKKQGAKSQIAISQTDEGFYLAYNKAALLYTGDLKEAATDHQISLDFGDEKGDSLQGWLEDESKPKVADDAKLLMRRLQGQDIRLRGIAADTHVMAYLCDPAHQKHPLPALAEKFLHLTLPEPPEAPKKKAKNVSLFEEEGAVEEATLARRTLEATYTAVVAELEPKLREALREIDFEKQFEHMEVPLIPVLCDMECVGMLLDPAPLRILGEKLETDARRLEKEIWELAETEFNIGSPKQLGEVLFEKLKLESGRKNKSGGFSTDAFTLERLAEEHEVVRKILEFRGTTKLKSTYVDALLSSMNPQTHRVHSTLNQAGTITGRVSSTDPNLQNVPVRSEQGQLIRKAFIAPKDYVVLSADYSQIELRILAHITGDAPLVDAFQTGEDVHSRTAAALFGVEAAEVSKEQRRLAKMTNYAIAYGVSGFGLAKQLGTGNAADASQFIKTYFETLPGVKKYIDDTLKEAKARGYVETLAGRRRPLPDINANAFQVRSAAERTAINHPIQGTAADMMKLSMLAIAAEMEERKLKSSMTMQVHDELVFEVPHDEVETMTELVQRNMSEVPAKYFKLKVPLVADVGTGVNWQDAKGRE